MHQLFMNILKNSPKPISSMYSSNLQQLVLKLLHKDPIKRISLKEILLMPFLSSKVDKLLSASIKKEEFSHTILHGKNQKV